MSNPSSIVGASNLDIEDRVLSQKVDLVYKVTVLIKSNSSTIFSNSEAARDGSAGISLEETMIAGGITPIIEDSFVDGLPNAKIENRFIQYQESSFVEKAYLSNKNLKEILEQKSNDYNKIILKIYFLGYNDGSLSQAYHILVLNHIINESDILKKVIDFENSSISLLSLDDEDAGPSSVKGQNLYPIDAQITAMLCHYVYYYLDTLEYMLHYSGLSFADDDHIKKEFLNNVDAFKAEIDENKKEKASDGAGKAKNTTEDINATLKEEKNGTIKSGLKIAGKGALTVAKGMIKIFDPVVYLMKRIYKVATGTSMLAVGANKVRQRIINRMFEVTNITKVKNPTILIWDILRDTAKYGVPYDFYEFYEKLGYWKYIGGICGELEEEAKSWHVSHPRQILKRLDKKFIKRECSPMFIDVLLVNDKNGTEGKYIYCNDVLISGMSRLSGYGGALFVKEGNNRPLKFCYTAKGTDVNSLNDWVFADLLQAFTGFSLQHVHQVKNSITIYKEVKKYYPDIDLLFCGHSLGGGLASGAAVSVPDCHAITYNAAGLNFIGSLWTRVTGAIANFTVQTLRPLAIAERVHPIRIQGEAVDVLMFVAKALTFNLNERAYGRYALELMNIKKSWLKKHGINNFLYNNVISRLHIPTSGKGIRGIEKITINSMDNGIECGGETDVNIDIAIDTALLNWEAYKFKSTGSIKLSIVKEITDGQLKTIYNN